MWLDLALVGPQGDRHPLRGIARWRGGDALLYRAEFDDDAAHPTSFKPSSGKN